jgi:hypothetical protein
LCKGAGKERELIYPNGKTDVASSFLVFQELSEVTQVLRLLFRKAEVKR